MDDHNDPYLQVYSHILKEKVLLRHFQIFGFVQMRSKKRQEEIKGKCLKNVLTFEKQSLYIFQVSQQQTWNVNFLLWDLGIWALWRFLKDNLN